MKSIYQKLVIALFLSSALAWTVTGNPPQKPTGTNPQLLVVRVDGKWGFIDLTGAVAIKPQFDFAFDFSDGLALVSFERKDRRR